MRMKPAIGRIVHYYQGDQEAATADLRFRVSGMPFEEAQAMVAKLGAKAKGTNGTRFHPAMITQVVNETIVNLQVFFGDGTMQPRQSVELLPENAFAFDAHCEASGWLWPRREG